jgi:hypothetical protein
MPYDVFTDGVFYPINLTGSLYVSEVDPANNSISVADTADDTIKGISTNTFGSGLHHFYDEFGRHVGSLTTGPGLNDINSVFSFSSDTALLSSAVVYPQNQPGVRGLRLDDGTVLTGEVTLVGRDGVMLSTNEDGTIRVDVVGTPGSEVLSPIVKNIIVYGNCVLNATQTDNVADISSVIPEPGDICTAKANIINPDGTFPLEDQDPCGDPVEPPTWLPCPAREVPLSTEPPCDHGGYFYFNAISPILDIKALEYPGVVVSINGINSTNVDLETVADLLPPRTLGALRFSMKS